MLPAPTRIGPYRVTRPLGRGGMGTVYLAHDTRLGREVALKLFSGPQATSAIAREQVLAEARAAAAINHPHIASVHDVLDVDGQVAIVFEYVEGETLADRLQRGRVMPEETIEIALQLTEALGAAHAHGIVHRDLKPANIALTSSGVVKVLDFGVARVMPPEADVAADGALTTVAGFVGTLGYAPPEQCLGQSVDARADVFSLGVVLFEMLTARRPFAGKDAVAVLQSMLSSEPPRVRSLVPDVPPELDGLIARMLASDASRRPASVQQVRDTLQSLAPTERTTVITVPARPHRWLATLLVAAAITAALVATIFSRRPPPAADTTPVVAVLPLINASGDAANDYLAIGFADSLITRLASLPSVTVLSRAAVADAQRRSAAIPAMATELDVTYFVDGTVQQIADGLRITLSLIRRDGAVAWADAVEGPFSSIFALQTRLASALGQALSVQLSAIDRAGLARQPTLNPDALEAYWRGRALLERRDMKGNVEAALSAFDQAAMLDPRFADAHAARGEALWAKYVATNDPAFAQSAIAAGTEALRLGPDRAQVRYSLAVTLENSGRLEEAIEELQHTLALQQNHDDARRRLGQVLARQGRIDEAIVEFDKAIALRPRYWGHHYAKGTRLLLAARYQAAAEALQTVIELQPDNYAGHLQLGVVYSNLSQHEAALTQYQRANELQPSAQAYSNIGGIHHLRGEYDLAVAAYLKALDLRPNSHTTHRNLGDAYLKSGRVSEARDAYQRALLQAEGDLQVNANDHTLLATLAVYHQKLGNTVVARRTLDRALSMAPSDVQVLFRAAIVHALAGRVEQALASLQAAVDGGFSRTRVAEEEDLAVLRKLPAFQTLTAPTP